MSRYCFIVSYDGTNYYGFQIQNALPTIELELMNAFKNLLNVDVKIYPAGRTDRFVHAVGQTFHVDLDVDIPQDGLKKGLNSFLPKDIYIKDCKKVSDDFHARFNAILKEYRYFINTYEYNPLTINRLPFIPNLNVDLMKKGVELLIGTHDFKAYASAQIDPRKSTIKTIKSIEIINHGNYLEFIFIGDGFLKYQIRRMMGMLIEVGKAHFPPSIINELLENKDPANSKYIADGCG
ncbi:MAG: tRNA pseudouridine(38-40) synthase TruA, partial [Anaeroplasmataceae bacterium]|nr:tRNA pseudouridine(38-40) synthase TruA [Anaeroplasmataceae bacterium]